MPLSSNCCHSDVFWAALMFHICNWISWPPFIRPFRTKLPPSSNDPYKADVMKLIALCSLFIPLTVHSPSGFWADSAYHDTVDFAPTRTLQSIRATAEQPKHQPRTISLTDVEIVGINHVGRLVIAQYRQSSSICSLHKELSLYAEFLDTERISHRSRPCAWTRLVESHELYPPGGIKTSARLRSRGGISSKLQDNYAHYSVTGGGGYKILELGWDLRGSISEVWGV